VFFFSNSDFVIGGPNFSRVISISLSNSSSSSVSLYNSPKFCCHLSVISSFSIRVFPSFDLIIVLFVWGFPKSLPISLYDYSVFHRLSWLSISSKFCSSHSSLSFSAFLFIRFLSRLYSVLVLSCLCFLLCSMRVMVFSLIHGSLGWCFKIPNDFFGAVVTARFKFSNL